MPQQPDDLEELDLRDGFTKADYYIQQANLRLANDYLHTHIKDISRRLRNEQQRADALYYAWTHHLDIAEWPEEQMETDAVPAGTVVWRQSVRQPLFRAG